jgi:ubiquinone/menaquinone biosynthesis C-methylase UbiE
VVGDAGALPFRDRSIDWAASSLFFHHFDGPGNDAVVGEMRRVARRGVAIADLRRTPWGPWRCPLRWGAGSTTTSPGTG